MLTCPSCGQANPEGFRLCGMCGASLAPTSSEAREEREVVSVLFCDLVGFTQRAEQLDPEEVRAILAPYHTQVREELERHGGTVEKFIGDAVMALFGAPSTHEDDPERAVRAALAIRDYAVDQGVELRIGITTGEVLVRLNARPSEGEGMASGDVVNTAARRFAWEAIELARENPPWAQELWELIPLGEQLGISNEIRACIERAPDHGLESAALAALDGDDRPLMAFFAGTGARTDEAYVRLMAAERLIDQGRRAEGEAELQPALEFYREVGATFFEQRGEALRAKSA